MNKIAGIVSKLAEPVAEKYGCELWDVEYIREAGKWYLRVYIDKADGIGITDCEKISRELDAILDETDPIQGSYIFEVSSAGAERQLKRSSDFARFMGSNVEVKLYKALEGQKAFTGILKGYDDGRITINTPQGDVILEKEQVANVRLRIV